MTTTTTEVEMGMETETDNASAHKTCTHTLPTHNSHTLYSGTHSKRRQSIARNAKKLRKPSPFVRRTPSTRGNLQGQQKEQQEEREERRKSIFSALSWIALQLKCSYKILIRIEWMLHQSCVGRRAASRQLGAGQNASTAGARPSRGGNSGRRHFNFVTKLEGRSWQATAVPENGVTVHDGICRAPEPLKSHFRTTLSAAGGEWRTDGRRRRTRTNREQKLGIRDLRAHKWILCTQSPQRRTWRHEAGRADTKLKRESSGWAGGVKGTTHGWRWRLSPQVLGGGEGQQRELLSTHVQHASRDSAAPSSSWFPLPLFLAAIVGITCHSRLPFNARH